MHELSIASAILDNVRAEAEKRPGTRVVKVGVRIGELAGVDPEALSFGFEVLVRGTELEPLALEIEFRPLRYRCQQCESTFELTGDGLACPACGSPETFFVSGDELELAYLELEERVSVATDSARHGKRRRVTAAGCRRQKVVRH